MAFSKLLLITFVAFAAAGLSTTTALNVTAFHDSTSVTSMTYITATTNGASSSPVVATSIESSSPVVATSIESSSPVVTTSMESSPVVAASMEVRPSPSSLIGGSSSTNFKPIDLKTINSLLKKYNITAKKVCMNLKICCKGEGNTDIIFTMEDCNTHFPGRCMNSTLTIKNQPCVDALKICTCRAAFLNTSLALVLLGVFLHLVGT